MPSSSTSIISWSLLARGPKTYRSIDSDPDPDPDPDSDPDSGPDSGSESSKSINPIPSGSGQMLHSVSFPDTNTTSELVSSVACPTW